MISIAGLLQERFLPAISSNLDLDKKVLEIEKKKSKHKNQTHETP